MEELFGDVVQDYRDNRRDTLKDVESRLRNHLSPFFGKIRAADFSTQHLKRYIARRRDDGAENATINRELAIVRRAFNLSAKSDPPRVGRAPKIQLLKETNIRGGFIEHAQYVTLRNELPPYLRPLFCGRLPHWRQEGGVDDDQMAANRFRRQSDTAES
jgi:hypothetical protein